MVTLGYVTLINCMKWSALNEEKHVTMYILPETLIIGLKPILQQGISEPEFMVNYICRI